MYQMGQTLFCHLGIPLLIGIFIFEWSKGNVLDESNCVFLLALFTYQFYAINSVAFLGLGVTFTLLGILEKMSIIFAKPEFDFKRSKKVTSDKVVVKLQNVNVSWGTA